ncbi:MAG TPA: hypothetical protein VGM69_19345 [Chloroflexota bacterium]
MRGEPLTPERWPDPEKLLGRQGQYAGCPCARPCLTGRELASG